MDGWLKSKKTKAEIARDAKRAKTAKKKKNTNVSHYVVKNNRKEVVDTDDESSFQSHLEDEDDDDEDHFSVHEDESVNDHDIHNDDYDDDDGLDDVLTSPKTKKRNSTIAVSYTNDSDSDSDEGNSYLPDTPARPSVPSQILKANAMAATKGKSIRKVLSKSCRKKNSKLMDSLGEIQAPALKKPRRKMMADDDEILTSPEPDRKQNKKLSKYFNNQDTIVLEDSDTDDSVPKRLNTKRKTPSIAIEDTPEIPRKVVGYNRNDSEDEGFNEDTRMAMKLSLQETKKKQAWDEADESNMVLLDDSSEEEDQGEEYYDQEKETATNVLRSAEKLSGHVVRAMLSWSQNGNSAKKGRVQGIIVDGVVALGEDIGDSDVLEENHETNAHKWISKSIMAKACPNVSLSGYQLVGVNWMALLNGMTCEVGSKGTKNVNGVLADEMGLGKTVQTIAFLAWLRYRRRSQAAISLEDSDDESVKAYSSEEHALPHLIVVPVSTLPNWMREFEKFCPDMHVIKYHGTQQEREVMKEDLREHLPKNRNKYVMPRTKLDVIVAPVSYFQKENSPDRKFLSSFQYDYLVVDEAHNLKNAKSTRYKMLDKVRTEHRLLLTGTPVQNNPQELLNMLSFIMPLFSKAGASFEDKDNYTEQMLKHFVDDTAEHGDEQTAYKKLKQLFAPFVLRRKKDDVIMQLLPPKKRETIFVELTASTRAVYASIIEAHLNKNGNKINPGTGENLFTNLRKCAHHPLLLRNRWNTGNGKEQLINDFYRFGAFKGEGCTKQRVGEEMESWNDFSIHLTALDLIDENEHRRGDLQKYVLQEEDLFCSSKFESLRSLLPKLIEDGHRILIFSSWTSCLDLLGCLMQHLKIQFQRMDGSCPSDERQRLIDQFNNNMSYSVFLLSTKACGLGINLTSADTCIIHDLDFNPFNDLQAEDRCHRIGQKKPVTVYKLITKDSVDEDIYKMQEKKAKMNAAIMDSSSSRKEKNAILQSVLHRAGKSQSSDDILI